MRYMVLLDRAMTYGRITPNFSSWGDVIQVTRYIMSNPPEDFNFFVLVRAESDAQLELAWERIEAGEDLDRVIVDPRLALTTIQTNTVPAGGMADTGEERTLGYVPNFSFLKQAIMGLQNEKELKTETPAEDAPYVPEEGTPEWKRWEFTRRMVEMGVIDEFTLETEVED